MTSYLFSSTSSPFANNYYPCRKDLFSEGRHNHFDSCLPWKCILLSFQIGTYLVWYDGKYIILTPLNPPFICKTGVYRGIHYLSYFCSKTLIVGTRKNRLAGAVLTNTHKPCFEQKYEKILEFLSEFRFNFFVVKLSVCLNRLVFVTWSSEGNYYSNV